MEEIMSVPNAPVAIITGSSRGIGAAIAQRLNNDGCRVVINYLRSEADATQLALNLSRSGIPAIACQADVGNRDDRQRLLQTTLNEFGQIDILVNNAGITSQGRQDLLSLIHI